MSESKPCTVTFSFTCSQEWDAMRPTADERVRHCGTCARDVHLCRSDAEAAAHGLAGHCVARAPAQQWDGWTVGEISPLIRWYAEREPDPPKLDDARARRRRKT